MIFDFWSAAMHRRFLSRRSRFLFFGQLQNPKAAPPQAKAVMHHRTP